MNKASTKSYSTVIMPTMVFVLILFAYFKQTLITSSRIHQPLVHQRQKYNQTDIEHAELLTINPIDRLTHLTCHAWGLAR
jgi:hypothetical protein